MVSPSEINDSHPLPESCCQQFQMPAATRQRFIKQGSPAMFIRSSQRMSSVARPRSSAAPSKAVAPSAAKSDAVIAPVEKEYIHNLQQQVYILECEAKYLRTKEQIAGPGPDAATLAANSFMGPPEDLTANTNLGDMAKDLKSRCAEVESKYQQQVRKANMAAAEYEQKKQYLKLNQQQLEQERDTALRQIEELFLFVTKQKDTISSQLYTLSDKERELNKELQTLELELKEMIANKHDALMHTSQVENTIRDCTIDLEQLHKETSNNQSATSEIRSSQAAKKEQIQQMKKRLQELMGCMNGQEEAEFTSAIQLAEQEIQQLQMREQQIKAQIEGEERKHESYSKELAQAQLKKFEAQQALKREELRLVNPKNVSTVADLRSEKLLLEQQFVDETALLDKTQARLSAAHRSKAKADADAAQASSELHLLQRKIEDGNDQNVQLQDDTLAVERGNREIRQKIKDLEAEAARALQEIESIMPKISQQQIKEQQVLDELNRLGTPRLDMREVQTMMDSNVQVVECIQKLSFVLQPKRS